jgi:hypothetical protein
VSCISLFHFCFETESHYAAQPGHELTALLPSLSTAGIAAVHHHAQLRLHFTYFISVKYFHLSFLLKSCFSEENTLIYWRTSCLSDYLPDILFIYILLVCNVIYNFLWTH